MCASIQRPNDFVITLFAYFFIFTSKSVPVQGFVPTTVEDVKGLALVIPTVSEYPMVRKANIKRYSRELVLKENETANYLDIYEQNKKKVIISKLALKTAQPKTGKPWYRRWGEDVKKFFDDLGGKIQDTFSINKGKS